MYILRNVHVYNVHTFTPVKRITYELNYYRLTVTFVFNGS